ncbi:MAG: GntR family transcriptional regulator, partial [Propionibacteriales bacterium]|nr:GntR family transcriptional regulator [Propionibacteriales bacterium]
FVLAELRRTIIAGELSPGQPLRQDLLAERFGVSRVPLREALSTLEAEGQAVYEPHRGYKVANAVTGRPDRGLPAPAAVGGRGRPRRREDGGRQRAE